MDQMIQKQKMDNKLVEIHQKEKEKELSLVELKIKELQKQMPLLKMQKLKPLLYGSKRLSVDAVPSRYLKENDYLQHQAYVIKLPDPSQRPGQGKSRSIA